MKESGSKPSSTKVISGLKFRLVRTCRTKSAALHEKSIWRRYGHYVRILQFSRGYAVYIRHARPL